MGVEDLLRVLVYHWSQDSSVFEDGGERQRVQLATILLFAAFTSARPAELVDGELSEKLKKKIKDLKWLEGAMQPPDGDSESDDGRAAKRSKALCYEDVCLRVLQDPEDKSKATLALEVVLSHHKRCDRKSKP